jgi:hypothetical protein
MKSLSCPNRRCSRSWKAAAGGSIILHGFYKTMVGEASPIPVPDLWEDVLLDNLDTLSSTPAPACDV